jgi:hypothetical protein
MSLAPYIAAQRFGFTQEAKLLLGETTWDQGICEEQRSRDWLAVRRGKQWEQIEIHNWNK